MREFNLEDIKIICDDSQEMKDKVFEIIIQWCKERELFNGESVCQTDAGTIDSVELVACLAEMIFEREE